MSIVGEFIRHAVRCETCFLEMWAWESTVYGGELAGSVLRRVKRSWLCENCDEETTADTDELWPLIHELQNRWSGENR